MAFLHGPEVIELEDQPRPVIVVRSSVIHVVGTALKGPVNQNTLLPGSPVKGEQTFGNVRMGGSIPRALDAIFDVHGAVVIVTNVLDPTAHFTAAAAADRLLIRGRRVILPKSMPFDLVVKAAGGGAAAAYVEGRDYTVELETGTIQVLNAGTIPVTATALNVAFKYPDETKVTVDDVVGGVFLGEYTGVHRALAAESDVGFAPKVLIAPEFTNLSGVPAGTANPVVAEMMGVAERLRAVILKDGEGVTDAAMINDRDNWGSRRVYIIGNRVMVRRTGGAVPEPSSARVAGLISKSDAERGFWWSPSNQLLGQGVVGIETPIHFGLGDQNSQANLLNEREVNVVIRHEGFRLWGNRTCSFDQKYAFLSVVRTNDIIAESLLRSHLWAIDRCMDKRFFEIVPESVKGFLDHLTAQGAILGGDCWVVPELNSEQSLTQGHAWFDYEFTPPYPAERITFRAHMTGRYINTILPRENRVFTDSSAL